MPPEGSTCPDTPCQYAQEYSVAKPLTELIPPLVSGETQKLCAFVGLVFTTLSSTHHSVDCCVAENGYGKNGDADNDWVVWHFFALLFFLGVP